MFCSNYTFFIHNLASMHAPLILNKKLMTIGSNWPISRSLLTERWNFLSFSRHIASFTMQLLGCSRWLLCGQKSKTLYGRIYTAGLDAQFWFVDYNRFFGDHLTSSFKSDRYLHLHSTLSNTTQGRPEFTTAIFFSSMMSQQSFYFYAVVLYCKVILQIFSNWDIIYICISPM